MLLEHFQRSNYSTQQRQPSANEEVLYHKDIGFPDNLQLPPGFNPVMTLNYGSHAKQAAQDDRYGEMRLPHRIDLRKGETVEIGVTGRTVTKLVVRFSYNDRLDIVMVIMPAKSFVKTVWFNEKGDTHKTLNRSKYADPNQQKPQLRH